MSGKEYLRSMQDICKSFPGVKALDGAHLDLKKGSVHALMGENGAGKSTLMKCLFGVYSPDCGRILLDDKEVLFKNPKEALLGGVAMVHQELNQAAKLSVSHNMWLGRFPLVSPFLPFTNDKKMHEMTASVLEELGIDVDPRVKMMTLSVSKRQMVEIAKAVSYNERVLVLDEPTSSLSIKEAEKLFAIIDLLKKRGVGIIYISHKMAEILQICDTVTVMRDGKHVSTSDSSLLDTDKIISLMVGRELTDRFPKRSRTPGSEILRCEGLFGQYSCLNNANLSLREGEILGVAGLDGSGRTELLEGIFGLSALKAGRIILNGKEIKNRSPEEAKKNGFALLTEERRKNGIFGLLDIRENTVIGAPKVFKKRLFLDKKRMEKSTDESIKKLRIKTPSQAAKIRDLSGGNQQKVILARWLLCDPEILLLDEPTRGIDVGAKYEIYLLLEELTRAGKSVIMVSSEMAELLGLCDRIIVMSGGSTVGEVDGTTANQEQIMRLACSNL